MTDHPTHILVVWPEYPDGELFAQTLSIVCAPPSYAVTWARSVAEASTELERTTYHIVITLWYVDADDDGIEFCRVVRSSSSTGHAPPPVIVGWVDMGARSYAEGTRRCAEAGAGGCFGRAFDIEGVKRMVDTLVGDPQQRGLHDQPVA